MNQIRVPVEDFAVCVDELVRVSARGSDSADPVFGNLVEELAQTLKRFLSMIAAALEAESGPSPDESNPGSR